MLVSDLPTNVGAVLAVRTLDTVAKMLPSVQEKRGDRKLEQARELAREFDSVIAENDRTIIEERIAHARDMKVGLDSKSGIPKLLHAQEYGRAAREAYKHVFTYDRVTKVARALYRCHLSCKDAFPSAHRKGEWVASIRNDACVRAGASPDSFPQLEEFAYSSINLLTDTKAKIKHSVESLYGFDTSRAPDVISSKARALLTKMTFIYREPNFGGTSHHPYRHPIIQKAINLIWFLDTDGDGIVFHEYFTPIPIQAMALVLTVIECCIKEWTEGTYRASNWNEEGYKTVYASHISSLSELRDHFRPHSGGILPQILHDLFTDARIHAGAPFELPPERLYAAICGDLSPYDDSPYPTITTEFE